EECRAVSLISHKLHEVKAVADRVTVLRGGRTLATVEAADSPARSLAAVMVGREVEVERRRERTPPAGDVLEVVDLYAAGDRCSAAVKDVSLVVRGGEIVGVAGVAGNGQRELAETITGLRRSTAGTVRVGTRTLRAGDPREAIGARMAHIPEDRLGTAV